MTDEDEADLTVRREWPTVGAYWAEMIEQPAALRAEIEHLRVALKEIQLYAELRASAAEYDEDNMFTDAWGDFIHLAELADKALNSSVAP